MINRNALTQEDLDAPDAKTVAMRYYDGDEHTVFTRAMFEKNDDPGYDWMGLYWHWVFYKLQRARQQRCFYAADGTLLNLNGSRNIFDDVDE